MLIEIKNKPSVLEPIVLGVLAASTIILAVWMALDISGITPMTSPILWGIGLLVIGAVLALTGKRLKRDGTLKIDTVNKLFSINGAKFLPYSELKFYTSHLIMPPFIRYQSRMIIKLGVTEQSVFSIMDDRASVNKAVGNNREELDALEELIISSSLTEEQKKSFSNWLGRARLIEK